MGRFAIATLVFVLGASLVTSAQGGRQPAVYEKGVSLAGQVSTDGKMLLADDDNDWKVSNAETLQGYAGRYVTVKCRMDPNHHAIRVLYVVEPQAGHAANLRDSAFRR